MTKFARLFKRKKNHGDPLVFEDLPWLPDDLARSLTAVTAYLRYTFGPELSAIGLFGSWQRGEATAGSDVDLVVFLAGDVPWFDADTGLLDASLAGKDRRRWRKIERRANTHRLDVRAYSITVVTPAMLTYYKKNGPAHLQNWVHAVLSAYILDGRD